MTYVPLSYGGLALAATLILLSGVLSVAFRLGLERNLLVAALRMIVQLTAVGFILKTIFDQASPLWTALFAAVMLAATGYEARRRQERRIEGWQALLLGASVPFMAGLVATVFAVTAVIGAEPWYAPRYLLPLLGMMAGNALAGVALVLDTMTTTASRERVAIEARLALGASRFEAFEHVTRRSLATGLMPILSAMSVSGLVSLPGMMTGQILAGADPVEATKYQIMIMFLIAGSTALAVVVSGLAAVLLLTDHRHRLRLDRLGPSRRTS